MERIARRNTSQARGAGPERIPGGGLSLTQPDPRIAEDMVRALLECLAHATYIVGLPPLSISRSPADRALCVELGMVKGLHDLLKKLPDDALMQDPSVRQVVAADEDEVRRRHSETGCKCTGRSDGHVGPMLKEAVRTIGPPWTTLVGVYASSSTFMHLGLLNRIVREVLTAALSGHNPADDGGTEW